MERPLEEEREGVPQRLKPARKFVGRNPEATGNEAVMPNESETRILLRVDWAQGKDENKTKIS